MVDAHCHLNFQAFDKDYDAAIKRALDAGVEIIINTGTSIESSQKAVELAQNLLFEGDRHRHTGHGLVSDMMIGRA